MVAVEAIAGKTTRVCANEMRQDMKATGESFKPSFRWRILMRLNNQRLALIARLLLLALLVSFTACNKSDKPSEKAFASPEDAGSALLQAAKSGDQSAMLAVLGPESKDLISSGDAVQDKTVVDAFVAAYGEMHRFRKMPDGAQILLVGADNFPFPFR